MSSLARWGAALLLLAACDTGSGDGVTDGHGIESGVDGTVNGGSDGAGIGADAVGTGGGIDGGSAADAMEDTGAQAFDASSPGPDAAADVAAPPEDAGQGLDGGGATADDVHQTDSVATDAASTEDTTNQPPTPAYLSITPAELATLLESEDIALINVHVPYAGTIPGTDAHVPYTNTTGLVEALGADKGAKAVLYCLTGPMSFKAVNDLVGVGFWNVYDLEGGMNAWKAAGYPIATDP